MMKLTIGQIHDAAASFGALENADIVFSPKTRLAIALNFNIVQPIAQTYEQTRAKMIADVIKQTGVTNQEMESEVQTKNAEMRAMEIELNLKPIKLDELDLENN